MIQKEPNILVNSSFVIFNLIYTASGTIFQIYNISQEGEALLQSRPLTAAFDSVITFASFHENIQPIWEFENALRLHVGIIFTPGSELRLVSAHVLICEYATVFLINVGNFSTTTCSSWISLDSAANSLPSGVLLSLSEMKELEQRLQAQRMTRTLVWDMTILPFHLFSYALEFWWQSSQ